MKNKIVYIFILFLLVLSGLLLYKKVNSPSLSDIKSFEGCVKAGFKVTGDNPKQCKTTDGRIFALEVTPIITYNNTSKDKIVVDLPFPGAVTGKEFLVSGKAAGWYFEGSFPVKVLDKDGKVLWQGPAQAQGDWMTAEFVPFKVTAKVPETYIGPATLVLEKDNPSGDPKLDASISFPFTIEY